MLTTRRLGIWAAALFGVALGASCDEGDDGDGGDTHEEENLAPVCEQIMEACHEKDDGTDDTISACHETAHDNDVDGCTAQHDACIEYCDAAPAIGSGGHDSGEHESGEHESGEHDSTGHDSGTGSGTGE